jgi:hypothetical protein
MSYFHTYVYITFTFSSMRKSFPNLKKTFLFNKLYIIIHFLKYEKVKVKTFSDFFFFFNE